MSTNQEEPKKTYIPLYLAFAKAVDQRLRCSNFNLKMDRVARVQELINSELPHGSGIDSDYVFDWEKSTGEKVIFSCGFHAMNDTGFYTEWIDYTVVITPSFISGFDIKITGNFGHRQDLKELLYELYTHALYEKVEDR